jgi:hypothetical protein
MKTNRVRTNAALLVMAALLAVFSARSAAQEVSAKNSATPHAQPAKAIPAPAPAKQQTAAPSASEAARNAAIVRAMDDAMEPGEGQNKLNFLAGKFDVRIFIWIDPAKPPIESRGVSVGTWVLGHRYIQQMLSGFVLGEAWSGIGYAGYDNLAKQYVACYMDTGSTGMEWYTGGMAADGKSAILKATIIDAMTLKPSNLEMRLSIGTDGDHITELWQSDANGKMNKIMELQYRRQQS